MTGETQGLEAALATAQADAEAAIKAAGTLLRELKKVRATAAAGQIRDLNRALEQAESFSTALAEQVAESRTTYDVDASELLESGAYTKELLAAAAEAGLSIFEEDGRLLCYPSLVRMLPGDLAIDIDRRKERRIRPSVVVELLSKAQQAGPRFKAEPFLVSLAAAYDLVVAKQGKAGGAVVKLDDVYKVLTLLPGQTRDYSRQEFARDLYLLDQSGVTTTKGGRMLRLPASALTRGSGVLRTVTRSGQEKVYAGIGFEGGHR